MPDIDTPALLDLRNSFERLIASIQIATTPNKKGDRVITDLLGLRGIGDRLKAARKSFDAARHALYPHEASRTAPGGITLLESDNPKGPWTPIRATPDNGVLVTRDSTEGGRIDGTDSAILTRAWECLAPKRWQLGSVIAASDIEAMKEVVAAIHVGAAAATSGASGDLQRTSAGSFDFTPTSKHLDILQALNKAGLTLTLINLGEKSGVRDKVLGNCVRELEDAGFVRRPHGPRKGLAITEAGLRAIVKARGPKAPTAS